MSDKLAVIRQDIQTVRSDFMSVNTGDLKFEKEVEFAMQILAKNDYLAKANPASIRNAVKNCALTDLTLNPTMKMAYLIPRIEKINGVKELQCQLEPSYMGLVKILTDTGSVKGISATIVYEKEVSSLNIQQGIGGHASHTPYIGFDKPGKPIACYSTAILPDGTKHVELLRPWEWEDIMKRSEAVKSYNVKKAKGEYAPLPTWFSDLEEMIRKTCIKKHYKYLPKTKHAEQIAAAIALDNEANGIDFEKERSKPIKTIDIDKVFDPTNEGDINEFDEFMQLLSHDSLPARIKDGTIDIEAYRTEFEKNFNEGKLMREAVKKWKKFIEDQIKYYTENPANESQETEDEF